MGEYDDISNEEHAENGRRALDELDLLAVSCGALKLTECEVDERKRLIDSTSFYYGAESMLTRIEAHVRGLVERFEELTIRKAQVEAMDKNLQGARRINRQDCSGEGQK